MRSAWLTVLIALFSISVACAEEKAAAAPPSAETTIQVTEADGLLWEKYQLLTKLADFQMQTLRLQNEKTLTEEYAKLNQRFILHYKMPVDAIERRGEQWIPRSPVMPPASK